jgi:Spy/CpxP family protein refolding chaperone
MQKKVLFLIPGAIALMIAAAPVVTSLNHAAIAAPTTRAEGRLANRLNLTEDQKARMQQIRQSTREQMETILTDSQKEELRLAKQQRRRPNLNLNDDQKARMQQIRQNAKAQMDTVLTDAQKQQLRQQKRERRQQRQQQPNQQL